VQRPDCRGELCGSHIALPPLLKPTPFLHGQDIIEDERFADLSAPHMRRQNLSRESGSHSVLPSSITASKPQHFYENVFTGKFDRVTVKKSVDVDVDDPLYEQAMLRSGVELVLYFDKTCGLLARGIIAGMATNSLFATYVRCSDPYVPFCYWVSSGATLPLLFVFLNVVVLVCAIQLGAIEEKVDRGENDDDPYWHYPMVYSTLVLYSASLGMTILAAPVDDQMTLYGTKLGESTGTIAALLPSSVGITIGEEDTLIPISEAFWNVLNMGRLLCMIVGWCLTCIDRVYMTMSLRHRDEASRLEKARHGISLHADLEIRSPANLV